MTASSRSPHTLTLAAAIPMSTAYVEPAAGHFFYNQRLTEIVETLIPGVRQHLAASSH